VHLRASVAPSLCLIQTIVLPWPQATRYSSFHCSGLKANRCTEQRECVAPARITLIVQVKKFRLMLFTLPDHPQFLEDLSSVPHIIFFHRPFNFLCYFNSF
jgi:hypothetical protein